MVRDVCRIVAISAVAAAFAAIIHFSISSAGANDNTTQNYSPNRFALLAGEINVSSNEGGAPSTRRVMLRTDTATGQCWILVLQVYGYQNFRVANASWQPIQLASLQQQEQQ